MKSAALAVACVGAALLAASPAEAACRVVDLEMSAERVADATVSMNDGLRVTAYRRDVIDQQPAAYSPDVIRAMPRSVIDKAILASFEQIRASASRRLAYQAVQRSLPAAEAALERSVPDFKCNFPIYLMDSLGSFDGAGRKVGGVPALILGIDQIAAEREILPLKVFLAHELFHRYHYSTSGFSDDPGEHQAIWRTLWAEGLATYASYRLTPNATVDEALIAPPNLAADAAPKIREIAQDLRAHLDTPDHPTYQAYFTYGDAAVRQRGLPWRSGYYAGFLIAQRLGHKRSLRALAHMKGSAVYRTIRKALDALSNGK